MQMAVLQDVCQCTAARFNSLMSNVSLFSLQAQHTAAPCLQRPRGLPEQRKADKVNL